MSLRSHPELVARLRAAGCVYAEDEADLLRGAAADDAELELLLSRRENGEPIELVVGWAEFCGRPVLVAPGAFVPRRRSELLAREAVRRTRPGDVVVDLCCGTGALGLVIAHEVPDVRVHAVDVDPTALDCARSNLAPLGATVTQGDLYTALPADLRGHVDVLVVNAPYVPTAEIALLPAEARDHEHRVALDGGADGLDLHRRVAAGAHDWLADGGHLLIETSERQEPVTAALLGDAGLDVQTVRDPDLDATVVIGQRRVTGRSSTP